jgi:hypothetical protein
MSQLIYADDKYKILKNYSGYILINKKGEYENHGHFKKKGTCFTMIKLIEDLKVPKSDYLREAALRISTNDKYKRDIRIKIEKDKQKPNYVNINKGSSPCY